MMNPQHQRAANLMNCPQGNPPGYPQYQPPPSRNALFTPPGMYSHFQPKSTPTPPLGGYPIHPDVKLKKLPFYDHLGELLKPSSLLPNGSSRIQEQTFVFHLTPQQATDIAMNRDTALGAKTDYVVQVQMRFCLLETSCEQEDCFPPGIVVKLNNKMCPLPNPIPTNKPGVDPRRPPRPVNVSHLVRLSPTVANLISVSWAAEFGRGYVIAVNLVRKLSSAQLLMRLKSRGIRHADYTTGLIKEKLSEDADSEIATTSLRVSLLCPLGKMRMTTPCRPCTCTHLQCFDASLYLQMNERKPTWMCPVCDKPATFDKLVIDGYFQDVLQSGRLLPEHSEIQLHQDGSWSTMSIKKEQSRTVSPSVVSKVEATTVEICDEPEVVSVGDEPKAGGESKKKAVVIDLTSDSDDETPAVVKKSNSISSKPDSTAKNSDTGSTVSTTGRSSVTSPGYISPNIITLDSPSPPVTPTPTTPPDLPLHTLPTHIPHIATPVPTYSASSLPLLEIDSDSNSPMYQHQRY